MPESSPAFTSINIHENNKNRLLTKDDPRVKKLAGWLRSPGLRGQVLRALIRKAERPNELYPAEDLQPLLLLSLAQLRVKEEGRMARGEHP